MNVRQYSILIVDDSIEDREVYHRYLSQEFLADYDVTAVESGEEALLKLELMQPDLILLDYMLPDCNGLEFIEDLKLQTNQIPPIIMLTGQGSEKVAVEAMKSGAKDYLIKGQLTSKILITSVRNVLQQTHLQFLLCKSIQQQQLIAETALRIRQSLDLLEILNTGVKEAQLLLKCDRVVIYRFASDMSGDIVAESLNSGWTKSWGQNIVDTCFQNQGTARYNQGESLVVNDIYTSGLSQCHIKLLEQFEVKAHIVCPLLLAPAKSSTEHTLWGLLIAHQCSNNRLWETDEIELLDKLSVQLAIAIQQAELLDNLQTELNIRNKVEKSLQENADKLKSSNRELRKTTSLLKKRNQELDRFAYVTSHDLKAPLRAIANLATWLGEDLNGHIPAENQQQLDLMQSRVKRMDGLIQGLLEYSRIGKINTPTTTVNLKDFIQDTLKLLSFPSGFEIIISGDLPTFKTKAVSLQQVLLNLIDNAIKYHPKLIGKIIVSVEEHEDYYQFSVSDDGMGIDSQYHERIFTIFQTLQARDTIESTGIGLSIVKKIVEDQGGKVWLKSQLGQGATFYFTWCK